MAQSGEMDVESAASPGGSASQLSSPTVSPRAIAARTIPPPHALADLPSDLALETEAFGKSAGGRPFRPVSGDSDESPGSPMLPLLDIPRPTLLVCLVQQLPTFIIAALILCAFMPGLFISDGQPLSPFYCIVYVAAAVSLVMGTFLAVVWRTRQLLKVLGEQLPPMLHAQSSDLPELLSTDPVVRFLQALVFQEATTEKHRAGPLDFIRDELEDWRSSGAGYTVIDCSGVILWVNPAVCSYFGYPASELLQANVRVLMPSPYAEQHDQFLRRHLATGKRHILGTSREVPVIDSRGRQSIVQLAVDDRINPHDATQTLFVGRMTFNTADSLLERTRERISSGVCDAVEACQPLDRSPHSIVAATSDGRILFMNRAAGEALGWKPAEVQGQNVALLMGEPFASAHDGFLRRYQERAVSAQQAGTHCKSCIVGSGRDVMAKTKDNSLLRTFLMVTRVDRPSRLPHDCVFVAKMVHIADDDGRSRSQRSSSARAASEAPSAPFKHGAGLYKWHSLGPLRYTKCSIAVLELHGMHPSTPAAAHTDYERFLGLVFGGCSKSRGVLHWVVGGQAIVTFNATSLVNTSHRSSCAAFLLHMAKVWRDGPLALTHQLYMAAVARECPVLSWGAQSLVLGDAVDVCRAMLRAAVEAETPHGLVDASLRDEVCYSYNCRMLNVLTLYPNSYRELQLPVFEVLSMKQSAEDDWMYQLAVRDDSAEALLLWEKAWDALLQPTSPNHLPSGFTQAKPALDYIAAHLLASPNDAQAKWLERVLQSYAASEHPVLPVLEAAGGVSFILHYHVANQRMPGTGLRGW